MRNRNALLHESRKLSDVALCFLFVSSSDSYYLFFVVHTHTPILTVNYISRQAVRDIAQIDIC